MELLQMDYQQFSDKSSYDVTPAPKKKSCLKIVLISLLIVVVTGMVGLNIVLTLTCLSKMSKMDGKLSLINQRLDIDHQNVVKSGKQTGRIDSKKDAVAEKVISTQDLSKNLTIHYTEPPASTIKTAEQKSEPRPSTDVNGVDSNRLQKYLNNFVNISNRFSEDARNDRKRLESYFDERLVMVNESLTRTNVILADMNATDALVAQQMKELTSLQRKTQSNLELQKTYIDKDISSILIQMFKIFRNISKEQSETVANTNEDLINSFRNVSNNLTVQLESDFTKYLEKQHTFNQTVIINELKLQKEIQKAELSSIIKNVSYIQSEIVTRTKVDLSDLICNMSKHIVTEIRQHIYKPALNTSNTTNSDVVIKNLTFCKESTPKKTPRPGQLCAAGLPCVNYTLSNTNKCFKVYQKRLTWKAAQKSCKSQGGFLAEIPDIETLNFLKRIAKKATQIRWTGGTDEEQEDEWHWATSGVVYNVTNWRINQPDNWNKGEHCMDILPRSGLWNDSPCLALREYICEKSADSCSDWM